MLSYIIEGGKSLEGCISISGSKNASLPIIAGSILSGRTTKLYNVPNIHDTQITLKILGLLGAKVKKNNGKIEIAINNPFHFDEQREIKYAVGSPSSVQTKVVIKEIFSVR